MSKKRYLNMNVYEAALKRVEFVFNEFEKICVSFSGGKDSGVVLNLFLDYMRRHGIKKKIGVLFIDLEGNYKLTIEFVKKMFEENAELIEPYWICLPINLRNAVSMYEPFWCCWEPGLEDRWIRPLPDFPAINAQDYFPFYRYRMEFEEFVPEFNKWFADGKHTASVVGIRANESLNRFRAIINTSKERYKGLGWTTVTDEHVVNVYPIYDWTDEDVWIANGKNEWKYNRLYDLFYRAGVSLGKMRICQPYGDDQRIGLELFRVIEPETWAKVVNRVSGANFGNIYCGTKAIGYRQVQLPEGHTWKSYTKLLLASLPPATRANYVDRFIKFMRYWNKVGCGLPDEAFDKLPDCAVVTDKISTRGKKDKRVVRYKRIPDHIDGDFEPKHYGPTWRRMAMCILKNDYLCKGLSFAQTKNQIERQRQLLEKYKNI
jgi:predicted phosphoadenosine phosphosulfate sulfurtransferase